MPTNMDARNNPNATVDVLEFRIPRHEFNKAVALEEHGIVRIPCCVVALDPMYVTLRKDGAAESEGSWLPETADQMETRLKAKKDK